MQERSTASRLVATMAMAVLEVMEALQAAGTVPMASTLTVFQTATQIYMAQTALEALCSRLPAKAQSIATCFD